MDGFDSVWRFLSSGEVELSGSALSFSRLNNGSPLFTTSPSFFNQLTKLPSSMDQPSRGIIISIGMNLWAKLLTHKITNCFRDIILVRDYCVFERRTVGCRSVGAIKAADGRIELIEAAINHLCRDLSSDATRPEGFIHDQ